MRLTKKEMNRIDETAFEFGLTEEQLMENAGRVVTEFVASLNPKKVSIVYGKGNNAGDALVVARHLKIKGFNVELIGGSGNSTVLKEMSILKNMDVKWVEEIDGDVVVEGLLGYNAKGEPRGEVKELIERINDSDEKVVSIDVPAGVNPENSERYDVCVDYDYVVCLGFPKEVEGEVYLGNIGIPNEVYEKLNIKMDDYFKGGDLIKLK